MTDLDQFREAQDESLHPAYRLAALNSLEASFIFLTDAEKALFREIHDRLYWTLVGVIEEVEVREEAERKANAPPVEGKLF